MALTQSSLQSRQLPGYSTRHTENPDRFAICRDLSKQDDPRNHKTKTERGPRIFRQPSLDSSLPIARLWSPILVSLRVRAEKTRRSDEWPKGPRSSVGK